jgi:hypothetical protein
MNIEDHLIKMKGGKLYCPVYVRIALFREKCPIHEGWGIVTECIDKDEQSAMFCASITDPQGRVIATGFKREHRAHFPDFEEKAGTGAVGRALLFAGFGTQYALDELDEGERIVDAPIPAPAPKQPVKEADDVVAQKAYKAAALVFFKECQRLWGDDMAPKDAKSVYRKIYGTETMTTGGLMDAATRLSGYELPEAVEEELFLEEE